MPCARIAAVVRPPELRVAQKCPGVGDLPFLGERHCGSENNRLAEWGWSMKCC